jgi:hypothetical protein
MEYWLRDGEVDVSLDCLLEHLHDLLLVPLDLLIAVVLDERGRELVPRDGVLLRDEVLLGEVSLLQLGPQHVLEVLLGVGVEFGLDALGEGDAGGVELVLDLLDDGPGGLEGEGLRALAVGEIVDDEVGEA